MLTIGILKSTKLLSNTAPNTKKKKENAVEFALLLFSQWHKKSGKAANGQGCPIVYVLKLVTTYEHV